MIEVKGTNCKQAGEKMSHAKTSFGLSKPRLLVVMRVDTSDEILAAENRHGASHCGIHSGERVRRFHLIGVGIRGEGVRQMRERAIAAEVGGRPDTAEPELQKQKRSSSSAPGARPCGRAVDNSRDGRI